MKTLPQFENVVGQDIAKIRLTESVLSARNDGEMLSPLITAEAGVGKSKIAKAYIEALEADGTDVLVFDSPEEFRSKGEAFSSLLTLLMDSPKYAIFIDEAHKLNYKPTVQSDKVKAFLMKALDKGNSNKTIRLDDEITVSFNRSKGSIVLATNFPEILDKSGALQSRCDHIRLDNYTPDQLVEILQNMLKGEGFQSANEATLGMIARCGRGTARPMEKIIGQLKITNMSHGGSKKTINREDVIHALKLSKMFPRGLNAGEIEILNKCVRPLRDNTLLAILPNMETQALKKSKGYLMGECEFAVQSSQGFQTTDKGRRYLEGIKKEGFTV